MSFLFLYTVGFQRGASEALLLGAVVLLLPAVIGSFGASLSLRFAAKRWGAMGALSALMAPLALLAWPSQNPFWLAGLALLSASAAQLIRASCAQYAASLFPHSLPQANGVIISGWQLTMFAATPFAGVLYTFAGIQGSAAVLALLAACTSISGLVLIRSVEAKRSSKPIGGLRRAAGLITRPGLLRRSVALLTIWNFAAGVYVAPLLYLAAVEKSSSAAVALVTGVAGLGPLFALRFLGGRGHLGRVRRLPVLLGVQAVAAASIPFTASSLPLVSLSAITLSVCNALNAGVFRGTAADAAPSQDQGGVFGVSTVIAAVGLSLGTALSGLICLSFSPLYACLSGALVMALVAALSFSLHSLLPARQA